jgi:hypothetical protein
MVAYTARTAPRTESHEPIERELSEVGDAIICAIVFDRLADAERHLRAGHALLSSLNSLHESPAD